MNGHQLTELRELIGGWGYRALRGGRPLCQWRGTTPHNWFIESSRPGGYLWHSDTGAERKIPNLQLFRKIYDSDARILHYWGGDSGNPELTRYVLNI